jgi:DNA polymerase-3 subunit gamma/tau
MYVVLARKYRPQTLTEVIGQEAVVRTLRNAITLQRIHHAYLFTGARGVGKTSIARILAKSLNCEKGPTDTPCGVCTACVEIARSTSPDVFEIDGASNTSVDNVRELRETVKYLPTRGKHKIYIIDEVHMLSTSAFNALLKTLEEPPEHVLFVFATTEPHKIPITILSRCQRFDFRRVATPVLVQRLREVVQAEGLTFDEPSLAIVAQAADGSVRDAMSLLDQVIAFAGDKADAQKTREALGLLDREKVRALLAAVLARQPAQVTELVQGAYASGADLSEIAERLVEAVRDLTVMKLSRGESALVAGLLPEELAVLRELSEPLSVPDLHRLFSLLVRTAEETAKSPFPHLAFEMGLLRACDLEPVQALAELVAELRGGAPSTTPPARVTITAPQHVAPKIASAPPLPRIVEATAPARAAEVPAAAAPPADYKEFTRRAIEAKPRLGTALEHVACLAFSATGITLSVPANEEVFADMLSDPDGNKWLHDFAARMFGRAVPVSISRGAQAQAATLASERRDERRNEVSDLKKSALAHPAVGTVLAKLGGDVSRVEVTPALSHPADDYD